MPRLTEAVIREKIKLATLMDDPFMIDFFRDNIPCVQFVLRVIMSKDDLIVKSVNVQHVMRAAEGSRYVRLDVYAVDAENRHYDIEVQVAPEGASPNRARYNSAMMDVNILKTGENYSLLKERESVVIFITEKDVLGEGEPIYMIDRVIKKSGKPFNDGSHIVYVNASYQDISTELGRLMHDFHCVKPEDMFDSVFAKKAGEMKGVEKMGVLDDWEREAEARGEAKGKAEGLAEGRIEGRTEGRIEGKANGIAEASESIARRLINAGSLALEEIADVCGLTMQHVERLARART